MDVYKTEIENYVYELEESLKKYTVEYEYLLNLAGGRLIRCKNGGVPLYYQANRKDGKYVSRRSVEKDHNTIRILARKEYLEKLIEVTKGNIAALKKAGECLQADDFDTLKSGMRKAYRDLPDKYFFSGEAAGMAFSPRGHLAEGNEKAISVSDAGDNDYFLRHLEWTKEPYRQSTYMVHGRKHMTSAGFRVRSKSEQAIVEQLVNYQVPFRYEQVIMIKGRDYSADFTFQDKYSDLFYWEHAGMMDQYSYVSSYYDKMNAYGSIGIVPWRNLIITYDMNGTINIPMVKAIIENEVIPRL